MCGNAGVNVLRDNSDPIEDDSHFMDEGWWASILADAEIVSEPEEEIFEHETGVPSTGLRVDWECIQRYHERDEIVELEVHGFNRGGLLVQNDCIQGFVPISHLVKIPSDFDDNNRETLLKDYLGVRLSLKVIECDPELERVVLSERAALAGEGCRKRLFKKLKNGDIVCGEVTNVTDFGAFVDLGGVEGLIHVSELSWGRVRHPQDILSTGQQIESQVIKVSKETERVALSYKRLFPNPWNHLVDCYQPGDLAQATITCIMNFGAFARMKEGVEGLIHISSMEYCSCREDIEASLEPGQEVDVKIVNIDVQRRRLGLLLMDSE